MTRQVLVTILDGYRSFGTGLYANSGCHDVDVLIMAFSIVKSLRLQAVMATFGFLSAAMSRWQDAPNWIEADSGQGSRIKS